jgi:hypothetical protein
MKPWVRALGLLLAALVFVCLGVFMHPGPGAPLTARYLYHTNVANGHGVAFLQIRNLSQRDISFKVDSQSLVDQRWVSILYHLNSPGPNSSFSGWLGPRSNVVIQVAAQEKDERFCLSYCRVPTRPENYLSWGLTWVGLSSPFAQKETTVFIYPGQNQGPASP